MARRKPPDLRRRPAKREPKRRFVIFCEGKNTEPAYFNALKKRYPQVDIVPMKDHGVPDTLARMAVEQLKRLRREERDSFARKDEVWAVFDRDQHPKFDEAVQRCEIRGVGVGRSNPCFEVWLILHFEDYHKGDDRHTVQERCHQVCPGYDKHKKRLDCVNLFEHVEAAINRAEAQLADRAKEGKEFGCPSTTVGRLVKSILDAAAKSRRP